MEIEKGSFICPECGSTKASTAWNVSRAYDLNDLLNGFPGDPWSGILEIIFCAQCRFGIPAHLAERWHGIPIEEAQREWREIYRAGAHKEKRGRR